MNSANVNYTWINSFNNQYGTMRLKFLAQWNNRPWLGSSSNLTANDSKSDTYHCTRPPLKGLCVAFLIRGTTVSLSLNQRIESVDKNVKIPGKGLQALTCEVKFYLYNHINILSDINISLNYHKKWAKCLNASKDVCFI